ncbi:MAG TPA: UDP-N-acetylglucosamine--N-acetylmuramyl-(pentapeptide) pyrophosphoryl-undecaprenol N-acetylglucosamine transferase [Opitutaceae bacterium]|nr:UDP-N-acetylglucosamine--N-acetylmuramyl-(pentapeptide) pyrophosphoryl-undecaprenol N-acetylglucosamine transferase [Opitutaceae bacterium]
MSRFLISCGGTGGHLSPGIALAEGLAAHGHEATLLISEKKVDARLSEKYPQLRFQRVPGTGFSWNPLGLARCMISQSRGFRFCRRLVREQRPAGVVGFGGFTSAPLVLAGFFSRVPVALHESNRVPGLAVRLLGRLARRVYLPPGINLPGVRASRTRHVGQPVRREIQKHDPAAARTALGLAPHQKVLVVFGGSQGASPLNDWVRGNLSLLAGEGVQVYCVTGLGKGNEETLELKTKTGEPVRAIFRAFTDRVAELMSAADLVVSRAGAGTLAELIRCETPAILVPFPQAADDHQRANAAFFAQQGGGLVVEQTQLATLHREVLDVMFNEGRIQKFRGDLHRMNQADALALMLHDLGEIFASGPAPLSPEPSRA